MAKKVISLQDYRKNTQQSLRGKTVVGSDVQPEEAVDLALKHKDIHVVNSSTQNKPSELRENREDLIISPEKYFIDVKSMHRASFKETFLSGDNKQNFLQRVESFLAGSKFRRVRDDIYLIADELYTNFSRTALDKVSPIDFAIDCDEERVLIYCKDRFGTLDPDIMLNNIKRCFDRGVKKSIRVDGQGGAGIGSYLMFTVSQGMTIAVQPGKHTLVLMWMPKMGHHEDRIEMNKDLCIIRDEEE